MVQTLENARPDDYPAVVDLLLRCGLPEAELGQHFEDVFVARRGGLIVACTALERHGGDVLLRSVAVDAPARREGLASHLVATALERAAKTGAAAAYLLTDTAPAFFARRGFQAITRSRVPHAVRQSAEFTGACCRSALAMVRHLTLPPIDHAGCRVRPMLAGDAPDVARIYNQGIDDRVGTFETRARTTSDILSWLDGPHPAVVVERHGSVAAFASTSSYRPRRDCYAGIAEFSVYVDRALRGAGLGRAAMQGLVAAAVQAGFWKLLSRVFIENAASRRMLESVGFREVGVYEKHAQLDGRWRDVVIVERLLPENQAG